MEIFKGLPSKKREYMNILFRNCTEEVNLIQLNKGKIVITKSQYMIMKKEFEYYVNGENVF